MDFVFAEITQRGHEEFGVESDGDVLALVADCHFLAGFADFGGVRVDFDFAFGEIKADGGGFLGVEEGDAADSVEQGLALDGDALVDFSRDDLDVVRVVAFDQFGNERGRTAVELHHVLRDADNNFAIFFEGAHQFGDRFGADDEFAFLAGRNFQVVHFGQGEAASVGRNESKLVAFEGEKDAVEHVAGFVEGDGVMRFAQPVFQVGGLELELDGAFKGGKTGEFGFRHAENFVNTGAAFQSGHAFAVHLDLDLGLGQILNQGAQTPCRQGGRSRFADFGFGLGADGEVEVGGSEDELAVGSLNEDVGENGQCAARIDRADRVLQSFGEGLLRDGEFHDGSCG